MIFTQSCMNRFVNTHVFKCFNMYKHIENMCVKACWTNGYVCHWVFTVLPNMGSDFLKNNAHTSLPKLRHVAMTI